MNNQIDSNIILCACGCGQLMENRDDRWRLRKYIRGHRTQEFWDKLRIMNTGRPSIFKGQHRTKKSREKMSKSHLGKPLPLQTRINMRGKTPWNKGKHNVISDESRNKIKIARAKQVFSRETRAKLSAKTYERWGDPEYKARLLKKFKEYWDIPENREKRAEHIRQYIPRGEKASGWRDGLSFIPYTKDFNKPLKEKIRNRDNHVCQLCGKTEKENLKSLTVHHIDYIKEHSHDKNLISLCVGCNTKVNINREFWECYFKRYLHDKYGYKIEGVKNEQHKQAALQSI